MIEEPPDGLPRQEPKRFEDRPSAESPPWSSKTGSDPGVSSCTCWEAKKPLLGMSSGMLSPKSCTRCPSVDISRRLWLSSERETKRSHEQPIVPGRSDTWQLRGSPNVLHVLDSPTGRNTLDRSRDVSHSRCRHYTPHMLQLIIPRQICIDYINLIPFNTLLAPQCRLRPLSTTHNTCTIPI